MFTNFYCSAQIIVPDRAVIPAITITATGPNTTTVRAGSMDPDTASFGLDFGPNPFILTGSSLKARLQNITTKRFEYTADHGGLLAVNMGAAGPVKTGVFKSIDADLIVTTTRRTTVSHWQKSANHVCLTAANNSAYLRSACTSICAYPGANATKPTPITLPRASFCPKAPRYPCPRCPVEKISTVPGCVDHATCLTEESLTCLCKPGCEMVNLESLAQPSALDGTVVTPIAAYCDAQGRCCRTFCYGYSSADLFPTPNQPHCGRCIDPLTMPWDVGALDQMWEFTSETGQISVTVLDESAPSVSSFGGSEPGSAISPPKISELDLNVLSISFHAEGGPAPDASWYEFDITGPGAPERSQDGALIWVKQVWIAVFPQWFFNVLFSGLLKPIRDKGRASLSPGFCPAYVPPGSPTAFSRLVTLNRLLTDGLERYPPGSPTRIFPTGSQIIYLDTSGSGNLFFFDPISSTISITPIVPLSFYTLIVITVLGLLVPFLLSAGAVLAISFSYYKKLEEFRARRLVLEKNIEHLTAEMTELIAVCHVSL